jgi:hypothetical protein
MVLFYELINYYLLLSWEKQIADRWTKYYRNLNCDVANIQDEFVNTIINRNWFDLVLGNFRHQENSVLWPHVAIFVYLIYWFPFIDNKN